MFAEMQRAQSRLHLSVSALEESSRKVDQQMGQLVAQRSDEFLELARHYLPDLSIETVEQSFSGVRRELTDLLKKKQQRERELTSDIDQTESAIEKDQNETDRVTEKLNEKVRQRDELQEEVANRLKKMPEYAKLVNEAAMAEQQLTANEQRMEQVEKEAAEKLPSYDNSQLFRYLYDRDFGTGSYASKGFTRRMDRWLARYIGFQKARKSYQFLQVTPKLMAAELERRRHQFNQLMSQVEAIEAQVEKEVGLPEVVAEGERLGELRDDLVVRIDDHDNKLEQLFLELEELRDNSGRYYGEALTRMKESLEQTEEFVLKRKARATSERQDDKIVENIVDLNEMIEDVEPEIKKLIRRRTKMNNKQAGFDELVRRFRSSNFDSHRSVFRDDVDLEKIVERFIDDKLDVRAVWRIIRKNQRFEESWAQRQHQNAGDILGSPTAQVIMHTMLDLAAATLRNSARRSVHRRNSGGIFFPGSSSSRKRSRRSSSRRSNTRRRSSPRRRKGGFTTGDGF